MKKMMSLDDDNNEKDKLLINSSLKFEYMAMRP